MDRRRIFGNAGESFAAQYLERGGYIVLEKQYTNRYGEIDLICRDGNEVVFVEVKARENLNFGYPEESVTRKKIFHILRVGQWYLDQTHNKEVPWRIDVLSLEYQFDPPRVTHIKAIDIPESN